MQKLKNNGTHILLMYFFLFQPHGWDLITAIIVSGRVDFAVQEDFVIHEIGQFDGMARDEGELLKGSED